jgi:AcrR family transcriptional regulator
MAIEELGPLPAGRHGFSREQVAHHQRERLIAGLAEAVAEKGYAAVTLSDIVRHAKVSRRVFYANFESKEQCVLAAFEVVVDHLRELCTEAVEGVAGWPRQTIAATRAALAFLDRGLDDRRPGLAPDPEGRGWRSRATGGSASCVH